MSKTLRLILGDQLNSNHSWFEKNDQSVVYIMMEIRSETDYVKHHIQKIVGIFASMQSFAKDLILKKHSVIYIKLNDKENLQSFEKNIKQVINTQNFTHFEYQLPDEYRVDIDLKNLCKSISIPSTVYDTEHFFTKRNDLTIFFQGKKTFIMENFYRFMRKKYNILMDGDKPSTGQWNYDSNNRVKLPKNHKPIFPLVFNNNVSKIYQEIKKTTIETIGSIEPKNFIWPINREQSKELLDFFIKKCLPLFGTYQDAMMPDEWSIYHSRISFSMNLKMISPQEVIDSAINQWKTCPKEIGFNQLEGFVRQILGWREYMRGIYWNKMPEFESMNFFNNTKKLPKWFWTGDTKMNCLRNTIKQSLHFAYAHHIQRLMITGNFSLLASVHPDEVDAWYLGIYIDAFQWVEITNTRGMSQFADGGIVGTKPYVSSATYIDKMSHYCNACYYKKELKTGLQSCPFTSLYWNFYDKNQDKLSSNPRIGMMYTIWNKMKHEDKIALLNQADYYLKNINEL